MDILSKVTFGKRTDSVFVDPLAIATRGLVVSGPILPFDLELSISTPTEAYDITLEKVQAEFPLSLSMEAYSTNLAVEELILDAYNIYSHIVDVDNTVEYITSLDIDNIYDVVYEDIAEEETISIIASYRPSQIEHLRVNIVSENTVISLGLTANAVNLSPQSYTVPSSIVSETINTVQIVDEIVLDTSETVFDFDNQTETPWLIATQNSVLYVDEGILYNMGKPVREMGINYFQTLNVFEPYVSETRNTYPGGQLADQYQYKDQFALMEQYGWKYVRAPISPWYPLGWQAYFDDKEAFFSEVEEILDTAHSHGLGIIGVVQWMPHYMSVFFNERVDEGYQVGSKTLEFFEEVFTEYSRRFANHPALAAWGITNEMTIKAHNPGSYPSAIPSRGTYSEYYPNIDSTTVESMLRFFKVAVSSISKHDSTNRLITTGNAGAGFNVSWYKDYLSTWLEYDNGVTNSLCVHEYKTSLYGNTSYENLISKLLDFTAKATELGKVLVLEEFGDTHRYFDDTNYADTLDVACKAVYDSNVPLALAWAWKVTSTSNIEYLAEAFHPNSIIGIDTSGMHDIYVKWRDLIRLDGYKPQNSIYYPRTSPGSIGMGATPDNRTMLYTDADYSHSDGFTVSFWIKSLETEESLDYDRVCLGAGVTPSNGTGFEMGIQSSNKTEFFNFFWANNTSNNTRKFDNIESTFTDPEHEWTHYVVSVKNSYSSNYATLGSEEKKLDRGFRIYVNGNLAHFYFSPEEGWQYDSNFPLGIFGSPAVNTGGYSDAVFNKYFARLAAVALKQMYAFNRRLTDKEIWELYSLNTAPQSAVKHHWPLNGTLEDIVGGQDFKLGWLGNTGLPTPI